jgi:hypothetical protein
LSDWEIAGIGVRRSRNKLFWAERRYFGSRTGGEKG